jgi:hypothetical protein
MEMPVSAIVHIENSATAEMGHRFVTEVEALSIQTLRVFEVSASISGFGVVRPMQVQRLCSACLSILETN